MLLLPRFELVFVIFLDKTATVGTIALLAPGLRQRTCYPSLNHSVSQYLQFNGQLPRLAHLEPGRIHLETMGESD